MGYHPPPAAAVPARRPFLIVSQMNGKVLDIQGGNAMPGARVIMWFRKMEYSPNQLWYLDPSGIIRSMLNDFALECGAQGAMLCVQPFNGGARQQWVFQGNRVVNRMYPSECIDIARAENRDGADVIGWPYKGSMNQHWTLQYV